MKSWITLAIACSLSLYTLIGINATAEEASSRTIILVRHAEKLSDTDDPGLTVQGQQRAKALVEVLNKTPLSLAITTQFARTRETLAPLIKARELPHIMVAASRNITAHIAEIKQTINQHSGNIIIAGHSNTVPLIIQALGGPKLPSLKEEQYDQLFILSIPDKGAVSLIQTQYGIDKLESAGN
ncbi:phosphoglycerate mutase family protein [Shewanella sp. Isolate11]|uniref:histidine phosphatase family protein n=1 Tax=Shewanella sp. Isolate11 TaxID=2908530 RepID=UPI001EFDBC08|nr:phosphoglycerate mutase family protein [Shewanella sp. Isolate11]MCG9695796.1 histidine phosphatase family protein [Shewanella sp. Isolate11]